MKIIGFYSRELRAVKDYFFQSNEVLWIYWYSGLSHLCTVLSGAPNGLNIVWVRHAWYEVNSRVKICTWPKTNICLKIKVSMLQLFQQGLYKKVSHPEKIVCLLDITYINQYKSFWPRPVFKPSKQVQRCGLDGLNNLSKAGEFCFFAIHGWCLANKGIRLSIVTKEVRSKDNHTHFEGLFFVVNVPNVSLKIRADWERSFTIFTLVGLLSCMGS